MNVRKNTFSDNNINNIIVRDKDPICLNNEAIKITVNIFLSAVENLMNRKNNTYKELDLIGEKDRTIKMITKSNKELRESIVKKIAHTIIGRDYKVPPLLECLSEETELKLIQYKRTQEEQRAIEKSLIKANYLSENLDISVNNLKYIKHLFFDFNKQWFATRYAKFSQSLALESDSIEKEWVYIRETDLKKIDIDNRIKQILNREKEIMKKINHEYFHYIKNLSKNNPEIFEKQLKISFMDIFHNTSVLLHNLTVKVEVPIKSTKKSNENNQLQKTKVVYKQVKIKIKLREKNRAKFISKSTQLNRSVLNNFMRDYIDSSDTFWILHKAIDEVIKQEKNKIFQIQKRKNDKKK